MNDILEKLKKEIPNHSSVVVATSGGPDSMVLLNLLSTVKKEKNLKLICAHVNHKLRKESDDEAKMVKKYCEQNDIIFEYMTIDEYKGNTENYAREKRYEFFEKLIKKYSSPYLLTAHHGDDLTETIMMRLIRGSSLKGYAGFSEITEKNGYKIIRPLITKTKEKLLKYATVNHLPYAIDKTNDSDVFTRNRIRKYILPKLKEENKNVHLKFLEYSKTLSETDAYFKNLLEKIIPNIYKENKLNIEFFLKEEPLIQIKIINYILEISYKNNINLINDIRMNNSIIVGKNVTINSNNRGFEVLNDYNELSLNIQQQINNIIARYAPKNTINYVACENEYNKVKIYSGEDIKYLQSGAEWSIFIENNTDKQINSMKILFEFIPNKNITAIYNVNSWRKIDENNYEINWKSNNSEIQPGNKKNILIQSQGNIGTELIRNVKVYYE